MKDPRNVMDKGREEAMGQFRRITTLDDLPGNKILIQYLKEAARLNDEGVKLPARPSSIGKKELVIPPWFLSALSKNKKALATFEGFPPSHKREYLEWITEAKREETRYKRITTTIQWLTEGKARNWKYEK